jgi:hypothetical protein
VSARGRRLRSSRSKFSFAAVVSYCYNNYQQICSSSSSGRSLFYWALNRHAITHIHTHTHTHIHTLTCARKHAHTHKSMRAHTHTHTHIHTHIRTLIHTCNHKYIQAHINKHKMHPHRRMRTSTYPITVATDLTRWSLAFVMMTGFCAKCSGNITTRQLPFLPPTHPTPTLCAGSTH